MQLTIINSKKQANDHLLRRGGLQSVWMEQGGEGEPGGRLAQDAGAGGQVFGFEEMLPPVIEISFGPP